MFMELLQLIRL